MKRNVKTLVMTFVFIFTAGLASAQVTKHTGGTTVPAQPPQYTPYTPAPVPSYTPPPVYTPQQGTSQAQYDAERQQIEQQIAQLRAQEQQLRQQERNLRAQEAQIAQAENSYYGTNYGAANGENVGRAKHDNGKHKGWAKNGKDREEQDGDGD